MTGWVRARLSRLSGLLGRRPHDATSTTKWSCICSCWRNGTGGKGFPEQAMTAARRQFGNTTRLREDRSDLQTFPAVEQTWRAVRYGVRQLRKRRRSRRPPSSRSRSASG